MHSSRSDILDLTEAATAAALAVLLGSMRVVELPNGGSITLAALPLLALAATRGVRLGVLAGVCAGVAHAAMGGTIVHPAQFLLDYVVATGALGLAGAARATSGVRLGVGITAAMLVQLAVATTSGVVFFAPAVGSGGTSAAVWYSLLYNAATIIPELVLALVLVPGVVRAICRADPADSWRRGLVPPPRVTPRHPRRFTPAPVHPAPVAVALRQFQPARPELAPAERNAMPAHPAPTNPAPAARQSALARVHAHPALRWSARPTPAVAMASARQSQASAAQRLAPRASLVRHAPFTAARLSTAARANPAR